MRYILLRLVIFLFCYLNFNFVLATSLSSQAYQFQQAESFILSQPQESLIPVNEVMANYRQLELRWVGKENAAYNHRQIAVNPLFAKTKLFTNSIIESNSKISYRRLKYQTPSQDGLQNVSGLLLLPASKPKGIILFFHSTISGKLNVPSLHFKEYKSEMLASIFAANGYIVAAPDYIGLGDNYDTMHPYILYPQQNVVDGKNILLATMNYLHANKLIETKKTLPLFVSGYSEGGSYALWFSRIYQTNSDFRRELIQQKLSLKKTVAIEGAYNLSGVMLPFLLSNQIGESSNDYNINNSFWGAMLKPSLLVNALLSYSHYNHISSNSLFNSNFYNLDCFLDLPLCGNNSEYKLNVDSLRLSNGNQFKFALNYFFAALFKTSAGNNYSIFNNSIKALVSPQMLQDKDLFETVAKADIVNWQSHNPVTLISLAHDSLVPENNSATAYAGMLQSGSTHLKYLKIDNNLIHARAIIGPNVADHVSFELYALLIALKEFDQSNSFYQSGNLSLRKK